MTRELLRPLAKEDGPTHVRHPMWQQLSLCGDPMYPAIVSVGERPSCIRCVRRLNLDEKIASAPTASARRAAAAFDRNARRRAFAPRALGEGRALEQLDEEEPDLVDVDLRCGACEGFETRSVAGDEKMRDVLGALVCQRCGAQGKFVLAPAISDEPRELPAHPEEP